MAGAGSARRRYRTGLLFGPGDIIGIDRARDRASWNRATVTDFEPNYLPYVEFYEEDFPWRYTPAAAATRRARARLRPWLTLVVLRGDGREFVGGAKTSRQAAPVHSRLPRGSISAPSFRAPIEQLGMGARPRQPNISAAGDAELAPRDMDAAVIPKLAAVLAENPDLAYVEADLPAQARGEHRVPRLPDPDLRGRASRRARSRGGSTCPRRCRRGTPARGPKARAIRSTIAGRSAPAMTGDFETLVRSLEAPARRPARRLPRARRARPALERPRPRQAAARWHPEARRCAPAAGEGSTGPARQVRDLGPSVPAPAAAGPRPSDQSAGAVPACRTSGP